MKPLIIYHKDCPDGFGSAFAAWKKFGNEADYLPKQHGEAPPFEEVTGRDVYMLDFSYKRPVMEKLKSWAKSLQVVDHHVTAQAELEGFPDCIFDMDHSGAYLSWQFFHPDTQVPLFVKYLEDRDLWKFREDFANEVTLAIMSYPYNFETWNALFENFEKDFTHIVGQGQAIISFRDMQLERMCQHVLRKRFVRLDTQWQMIPDQFTGTLAEYSEVFDVPFVNCPLFQSELGAKLAINEPFAVLWWKTQLGIQYSLRSSEAGLDVSQIAKSFGGGGHKHAAGFEIKD